MKMAFFDRDGTIIEDYPDNKWTDITQPVFMNGAIATLKAVLSKGYKIIIVTNQYIINEGYITLKQYHHITKQMLDELAQHDIGIYDIYYCPHAKLEGCSCMKPRTGMIKQALLNHPEINLSESFIIGDSIVDVQLAVNLNMKGFGIGVGSDYGNNKIKQLTSIKDLMTYL
ncbi:D-glycero-alpha-D-manno-heptose-1,7-bisphosphate 7-phosphatase [Evansella cellulosilytica]|uniref:D,D-heptose 1,7-bisphosphate phosphatase n=1 Tax=Evansella cellulosilytica (strain ATCC 21833 / DSM 2522 / FERM P-1141 / JCM 9156 / N-4) TaxID=649639 RepID=E6U1G9_EVAC2|nr:HAD-IIIA family hydrolase [Evansella cellulosilytica]ADU29216.1 histidinol-phosphate phosphatase family protein [Evansella cellulosilytica DSM 2522]